MESKLITSECKHYICPGEMSFKKEAVTEA